MTQRNPMVGVAADTLYAYGRQVIRGALRYANASRRWRLVREFDLTHSDPDSLPKCDGAIVAAAGSLLERYRKRCRCVVACSGSAEPDINLAVVCMDDIAIGRLAAEHLLDCRLTRFGYYGKRSLAMSDARLRGFCDALDSREFPCDVAPVTYNPNLVAPPWTMRSHWPELIAWLRAFPVPVGIFAMDDMAAHDLASACEYAEIPVPDRIAIVGVNNDDLLCESSWPPLSSVDCDFARVGYAAARELDQMLRSKKETRPKRKILLPPVGIISRTSTDLLAVDDADLAKAVRYIREHACDPCSVTDVLKLVPVSRRWLEKLFMQKLGRSPNEEILNVRMQTARRLLTLPDISLEEIARHCGFMVTSSFSRAFHRTTGETPAAYRRARRKHG